MKKKNWLIFSLGLILFVLGFVLLAFVGKKPEGVLGLVSPLTVLCGVIVITLGFLKN